MRTVQRPAGGKRRRRGLLLGLLLGAALLTACGADSSAQETAQSTPVQETEKADGKSGREMQEYSFFAMDTYMDVKVLDVPEGNLVYDLESEILRVEDLMSVTIEESDLYRINHAGGETVTVSEEVASLIGEGLANCALTDGALNIALYPLSLAWGFSSASTEGFRVVPEEEREEILPYCDWTQVRVDGTSVTIPDGFGLDLGGVAKGYALDCCVRLLTDAGAPTALIYLGGDVYALGSKEDGSPWRVAIQDPNDSSGGSYVGVLEVTDLGVVTSGTYERYFEEEGVRYHHILDSETGAPAESGLNSVSLICRDGTLADSLATAYLDMGLEASIESWRSLSDRGVEVIWVTDGNDLYITEGLTDLFTASSGWSAQVVTK